MRNWASAAHPNQSDLTGLNLISWLEMCIKEVIATSPSNIQIQIGQILNNIKSGEIDDAQASMMISFFTELSTEKADTLAKGFFGIYIDKKTNQHTRSNINKLAPELWKIISEEVKSDFGVRYAMFLANGDQETTKVAKLFLDGVGGMSYLPESVKTPIINASLENLLAAHNGINNFYNEPSFALQLRSKVGSHGAIPSQINFKYVKTIVTVFLTNGAGEVWAADPIYIELIKNFDGKQSFIALISFQDSTIKSKLQFGLCQRKFLEMLDYLEVNITSQGVLNLLSEIKDRVHELHALPDNDNLNQKISFYRNNYLK